MLGPLGRLHIKLKGSLGPKIYNTIFYYTETIAI